MPDIFLTILICILTIGASLIIALAAIEGASAMIREIIQIWRDIRR